MHYEIHRQTFYLHVHTCTIISLLIKHILDEVKLQNTNAKMIFSPDHCSTPFLWMKWDVFKEKCMYGWINGRMDG